MKPAGAAQPELPALAQPSEIVVEGDKLAATRAKIEAQGGRIEAWETARGCNAVWRLCVHWPSRLALHVQHWARYPGAEGVQSDGCAITSQAGVVGNFQSSGGGGGGGRGLVAKPQIKRPTTTESKPSGEIRNSTEAANTFQDK